jgi:flagellar basal body-associated protein FliL
MPDDMDTPADAAPRKSLPIKTIVSVVAVLLIEAVAISAVFMLSQGPEPVTADEAAVDAAAEGERPVEHMVVSDKFQNTRTGRAYLYDTEIYIVVKQKHLADVTDQLDVMRARISTDIAEVFRKAEPSHLLEPELATLRRQIKAALTTRLGHDADGDSLVMEVVIPRCKQYRADL